MRPEKVTLYIILLITFTSCNGVKDSDRNFDEIKSSDTLVLEIRDSIQTHYGDKQFIVFTNAKEDRVLLDFADSLIHKYGIYSGVAYFTDSERVAHFELGGNIVPHDYKIGHIHPKLFQNKT